MSFPDEPAEHSAWEGHDTSYYAAPAAPCVGRGSDEPPLVPTSPAAPVASEYYAYVPPVRSAKRLPPRPAHDRFKEGEDDGGGRTEATPLSCTPAPHSERGNRRPPPYRYRYYYHTFPDPAAADNSCKDSTEGAAPGQGPCYFETLLDLSDYLDSDSSYPEPTKHERELETLATGSGLADRRRRRGWWWRVHQAGVVVSWVLLVVVWMSVAIAVSWRVKGGSELVSGGWDGNRDGVGEWAPCTAARPRFCRLVVGAEA
ncbi:uncharacterized protein P884DRAFT_201852 [Thermothelomyces heterothallicus CBS 202.75]|uniref:uncharacterized protein n=1 Tax=Thermothelomyces heterothallicus CBS 202.75 TaxID=1149848 RepID=UPI0037428E9D